MVYSPPQTAGAGARCLGALVKTPKPSGFGKAVKNTKPSRLSKPGQHVREMSEPFHHNTAKFGPRKARTYHIHSRWVKILYPEPPTAEEQEALLNWPAVVCPLSTLDQIKRDECPVMWLLAKLKGKFGVPWAPDVLSAAVPSALITEAKATGDWGGVKRIHEYAYVERRGCHIAPSRGCPSVPRLFGDLKMGVSRFGNPFVNLPLDTSRALFERYVDNDFRPLCEEQVQEELEGLLE
jgi:hypothetical protein